MIEKTRTQTRSLTQELLELNRQMIAWNLDANKRIEKQVIAAFDASRSTVSTIADVQRSTVNAWLDAFAPVEAS